MALVTVLASAGCAQRSAIDTEFCQVARPIFIGEADELTELTAWQIERHNEIGAARCGWAPNDESNIKILSF